MGKQLKARTKKKKEPNIEDKYIKAQKVLRDMSHSSKPLYKAMVHLLNQLSLKEDSDFNATNINTVMKFERITKALAETSRKWTVAIHYLYMVCNPKINDKSNPKYSPVFINNQGPLPLDQFGELLVKDLVIDEAHPNGRLLKHGDRLVGDKRFKKLNTFGSAWDAKGEVIKRDDDGHPVLDGFVKWVAEQIDSLKKECVVNPKRDRSFQGFMIAHTRDTETKDWEAEPRHKEAHVHIVLALSFPKSRYQIMTVFGTHFEDYVTTLEWIDKNHSGLDDLQTRLDRVLDGIIGDIKNFNVSKDYQKSLQYLVHQTENAMKEQKATYSTSEVISWLPDNPNQSYESIAGVYDNEGVARGVLAQVMHNLDNSLYNRVHHTREKYVGLHEGEKAFTPEMLVELRQLGKKKTGKTYFSVKSKQAILSTLMAWIRIKKIEFSDWQILIHGAFGDDDADALITDKNFVERLLANLDAEKQAIIADPDASRQMTTYCIFAKQGGIGKTRLANAMALLLDKNRKPYQVVTKNKQITFDPFQNYESERSVIMDELSPSSIGWAPLKDLLDPYKIPYVGSRFHNKSPWNVHQTFITNVFEHGIADYVTGVLRYSEGVSALGYLKKDGKDWLLITNDVPAGKQYVAQLSQLLRRLPIVITLESTQNNEGTAVTVSIINFKSGGRGISHYDYVHTKDSVHVFRTVINDDLADDQMEKIAQKVLEMIATLRSQAQVAFMTHPGLLLDEIHGFLPAHCDFLVRHNSIGDPYLDESGNDPIDLLFAKDFSTVPVSASLLSKLNRTQVFLWDDTKKTNVTNKENQLDALMNGYEVPIAKTGFDTIKTIKLTDKAKQMVKANQATDIWYELTARSTIAESNDLFSVQSNTDIANFRVVDKEDIQNGK